MPPTLEIRALYNSRLSVFRSYINTRLFPALRLRLNIRKGLYRLLVFIEIYKAHGYVVIGVIIVFIIISLTI